jgi:hypothetical protein
MFLTNRPATDHQSKWAGRCFSLRSGLAFLNPSPRNALV